ncbi:MAG: hypothetical protein V4580_08140 [Bacteroidota bacterium]
MKTNYSINNFSDLEREELRLKMRLKSQEAAIKLKLKTLPEEIVKTGITRLVTGILNGNIFNSAVSIIKTIGSVFSGAKRNGSESETSIMDIIKTIVKNKVSNS